MADLSTVQNTNDKKYSVFDSIWVATAAMAYEKYYVDGARTIVDFAFGQADIRDRAEKINGAQVEAARTSQWVCGDHENHTYSYLRAVDVKRRLTFPGEFGDGKEQPADLNLEDVIETKAGDITIQKLVDFVHGEYKAMEGQVIKEVNIDYIGVLDYLRDNAEIPYSNPDADGIDADEKQRLLEVKEKGQAAVAEMKKMATLSAKKFGLTKCLPMSWLDGSNTKTRKYLWAQMKYDECVDNPASISIFVEKSGVDITTYRISLEMKNDGSDKKAMAKYHSHLEIPLNAEAGLVYVAGSNEWGHPSELLETQEAIKSKVESGELRKVQICKYVRRKPDETNEYYHEEIFKAIDALLPYYDHVVDRKNAQATRGWLVTWNPANWNWENYEELCVSTKEGATYVESWTCASKQPAVGDDVFLMKTGDQPRGIIAHGRVAKASYEAPHYDPDKAAAGVTASHIDVKFDWIQNYSTENMLSQDELKVKFPEQTWSPMGSGIEIKDCLKGLKEMWSELIYGSEFWPSADEYPVNITKDEWKKFIEEVEYPDHKGCMRVLKCFIEVNGIASPKQLAERFGGHPTTYTSSVLNTSRRAMKYFNMEPCPDGEYQRYFPVGFQGKGDSESGNYVYRMREELFNALLEIDLSQINIEEGGESAVEEFDKNLILYGPPGTGKTYNSAIYAVAICDGKSIDELTDYDAVMARYNELKAQHRVAFTTFHQSYGYEEFIEGIKPVVDGESDNVSYTIEPGAFKRFCEISRTPANMDVDPNASIWFMRLDTDNAKTRKDECFEKGALIVQIGEEDAWSKERFVDAMQIGDYVLSYAGSSIYIDAVGVIEGEAVFDETRESYQWSRKVKWYQFDEKVDVKAINGNTYLPNFSIAKMNHMKLSDLLRLLPQQEVADEAKPYVFIIDEINRGNISKIFGELITLIENTKREGMAEAASAILPYSGEAFSVPSNVYILGTMNTADRSIALMDTALRRRFQFIEMMPDSEVLRSIGADKVNADGAELDVATMLETINERISFLYDREHTIGHAFFTGLKDDPSVEKLASIFAKSVIPLLQEYFYEDYQKIQLVLGDNGKSDDNRKFIKDIKVVAKNIFKGSVDDVIDLPEKKYEVNEDALFDIQSYIEIM